MAGGGPLCKDPVSVFYSPSPLGYVETETMWEDECRHYITIASDHPKHHNVDWLFSFH